MADDPYVYPGTNVLRNRALSLAFFLAEVAVSDERSAVIFDGPVSSLDHARRAYLAERLRRLHGCP